MKNNIIFELFLLISILVITSLTLKTLLLQKNGISSHEIEINKSDKFMFEMYTKQNCVEEIVNSYLHLNLSEQIVSFSVQHDTPIFVYRYSAFNCDVCVKFGNTKIEEYFSDKKNSQQLLYIISDFQSNNNIQNAKVIDIKKNNLGLPVENSNQPFYFVLINNCIRHVFIPDKSFPDYTDLYLREIKKRYFNN